MMTKNQIQLMRQCSSTLPPPGDEVVLGLLDEIELLIDAHERIDSLNDELNNGIILNEFRNVYELRWTQKQLDDAKKRADEILRALNEAIDEETP